MPLLREETFAPVVTMVEVRDEEEALQAAAKCPFGLGASVFGHGSRAREFAKRVQAGFVTINDVIAPTADPRLPFGGRGHSGFGVTRGGEGLLEMTTVKVVAERRARMYFHFDPPSELDAPLFSALIQASHHASWITRVSAWLRVARLFRRKARLGQKTGESN
jgi:aldehyde dehydrogenase (NAD+)